MLEHKVADLEGYRREAARLEQEFLALAAAARAGGGEPAQLEAIMKQAWQRERELVESTVERSRSNPGTIQGSLWSVSYTHLDVYKRQIPKHLIRGTTLEEARNYCTNCVETDIEGMTDSRAHSGYVNFPKCFLLAMNDGVDPESGRRVGPSTGKLESFTSFDELFSAYKTQVAHFTKLIVDAYDLVDGAHAVHTPEPFMSSLLDDCIERGMSRQEGGVRYNFSGIFGVGLASVADSMAAVRRLCFDDRSVPPSKMLEALKNNFQGEETLLDACEKAPKFGNDDDYVDLIARDAAHVFCSEVTQYPCMRGGFYIPELHSVLSLIHI